MLILPIIKNSRIVNYQIQLREQEIIQPDDICADSKFTKLKEGEVYSNGRCYSRWFDDKYLPRRVILDNIKCYSNVNSNNLDIFVSTKNRINHPTHDIYRISIPVTNSDELKSLYAKAIDDVRRSIPDHPKGKVISLEKLGVGHCLFDNKIEAIKKINEVVVDENAKERYYYNNKVTDVIELVRGLKNNFSFTRISDGDLDEYVRTMNTEKEANTDLYRKMQKTYDVAAKNTEIFSKIAKVAVTIDNSKNKVKYKVKED